MYEWARARAQRFGSIPKLAKLLHLLPSPALEPGLEKNLSAL